MLMEAVFMELTGKKKILQSLKTVFQLHQEVLRTSFMVGQGAERKILSQRNEERVFKFVTSFLHSSGCHTPH